MLPFEEFSRFQCGDMTVLFLKKDKRLAFTVIPQGMESEIPAEVRMDDRVTFLPDFRIDGFHAADAAPGPSSVL